MTELIKAAAIPVILITMIITSAIFLAGEAEGALVTTWVSATITAFSGYVIGKAVPVIYKGYKALKRGK
ncbi:hypothetical protein ES708_34191 [subsurface metagenome]